MGDVISSIGDLVTGGSGITDLTGGLIGDTGSSVLSSPIAKLGVSALTGSFDRPQDMMSFSSPATAPGIGFDPRGIILQSFPTGASQQPMPTGMDGAIFTSAGLPVPSTVPPLVVSAAAKIAQALGIRTMRVFGIVKLAMDLVRKYGIQALIALGLGTAEIAALLAYGEKKRRRRRRGITARDLRVTGRTIRKITSMQHRLAHLCGGVRRAPSHRRPSSARGIEVVRAG